MAYNGKPFFKIPRPLLLEGGIESATISGAVDLDDKSSLFLFIDGGLSDQDINLPAEKNGRVYHIKNTGSTNALIVKNVAAATIVTIAAGGSAWIVSDGSDWHSF